MKKLIYLVPAFILSCSSVNENQINDRYKKLETKVDSLELKIIEMQKSDSVLFEIVNKFVLKPEPGSLLEEIDKFNK